jgi:hypothetical protein
MQPRLFRSLLLLVLAMLTPFLSACGLLQHNEAPAVRSGGSSATPVQANPGEREGTIPATAAVQTPPVAPAGSPQLAVERFAETYINWTYKSIRTNQTRLAESAIGEARTAELQAHAQTVRDTVLQRAHIYNAGTVVAAGRVSGGRAGEWVVVTREQTGGSEEYAGTQAGFHVTLATVQRVTGGWAVSAWRPQV